MKKILLLLCLCLTLSSADCLAASPAPKPTQRVFLFYKVADTILQCQNADEDMIAGTEELEKELLSHYGKRFIVQDIKRSPLDFNTNPAGYRERYPDIKISQKILIVKIELEGEGTSSQMYQNAYGAKTVGIAPTINVHLLESISDTGEGYGEQHADSEAFYSHDYGTQSYGAGTFAVGRQVYAAQTDPRKNVKNAVRASFRDACDFNQNINKYAAPAAYESELNRFTGNFKVQMIAFNKQYAPQLAKIKKFAEWCNADATRKEHWTAMTFFYNSGGPNNAVMYIDKMIEAGLYKEE